MAISFLKALEFCLKLSDEFCCEFSTMDSDSQHVSKLRKKSNSS